MINRQYRLIYFVFAFIMLSNTSPIIAQELLVKDRPEISRDSLLTIAHAIIDSARARTFITVEKWKTSC